MNTPLPPTHTHSRHSRERAYTRGTSPTAQLSRNTFGYANVLAVHLTFL